MELESQVLELGFQYKRAAAAYEREGRMSDAVKLLETLYDYRRAIQILVTNNRFDAAIDILKRYEMKNKVAMKIVKESYLSSFLNATTRHFSGEFMTSATLPPITMHWDSIGIE